MLPKSQALVFPASQSPKANIHETISNFAWRLTYAYRSAEREVGRIRDAGVDGLMLENMHDTPYRSGAKILAGANR